MGVAIHNINVGKGDCLLICSENYNILVDCGKYSDCVKAAFKENNIVTLDLVIVTHIDNDHIDGVIDVINHINVKNIVFNGFHHIPMIDSDKPLFKPSQDAINIIRNYRNYFNCVREVEGRVNADKSMSLSELIRLKNIPWNEHLNGERISSDSKRKFCVDDIKITILSPNDYALKKTYSEYRKFIFSKLGYALDKDKKEDISQSLYDLAIGKYSIQEDEFPISHYKILSEQRIRDMATENCSNDKSVSNNASLAFIIEIDKKRILILGDANPLQVESTLRQDDNEKPIMFDVIKVSHHGSNKNTTSELLSLVDSHIYIFCGGGRDKPGENTISKIISRPTCQPRVLYFNRPNSVIEKFNNTETLKDYFKYKIDTTTKKIML